MCHLCALEGSSRDACTLITALIARCRFAVHFTAVVALHQVAAEYGILIMMACHRLNPNAWPGDGLWFDAKTPEARVIQSWDIMAAKLCSQWNVFGVVSDRSLYSHPLAPSHPLTWFRRFRRG